MDNITAILNIYKRPHTLDSQIHAILNQTIPPKCIFIWNNGNKDIDLTKYKNVSNIRIFDNNFNYGVWSRFLIGFLAPTDFICIFDDDTIPGNRWFENCVESMKKKEALYGTIGVIFDDVNKYTCLKRYGWDGNSNKDMPVDIVGHSWFFRKEWLNYFTRESPQVYEKISNGEDIHFSFMLQKYANIPTYVPPHPKNDTSLWGSQSKTAWQYGCDGNSETGAHYPIDKMFTEYISRGFNIFIQRQNASTDSDFIKFTNMIKNRKPFALIRPSDGEYYVLKNNTLTNTDKWTFYSGGKLSSDLNNAINVASKTSCYIGIPCECCNRDIAKWYYNTFNINPLYVTFANIFVNNNWTKFVDFFKNIPFTFIGPKNNKSQFLINEFVQIPEFLVNDWDAKGEEYIEKIISLIKKKKNEIFLFSCGPIAKIFISKAWVINPNNIYLDIGSSLDSFLKDSTNREYIKPESDLSKLVCKFSSSLITL